MKFNKSLCLVVGVVLGTSLANAGTLTFTCDSSVDNATTGSAGTCTYLNTVIAPLYTNTFNNLNADIYITMGTTGLGSGKLADNFITYNQYATALAANATASGNPIQVSAVAALAANDATVYGTGNVELQGALAQALGFDPASLNGYLSNGDQCTGLGTGAGATFCYEDVLTITTPANLYTNSTTCMDCTTDDAQYLYWRQNGGAIGANAYDFYSVVEHETDEALGTTSCINTQDKTGLDNWCGPGFDGITNGKPNTPSAADLFRYLDGDLVPDSSFSTTAGAYFSYNGGVTNGANLALYNTLQNGNDYGDYASNCKFVQDATGCLGKSFDVTTDGGELNILNAEGYTLAAPEPGTIFLFGAGLAAIGIYRRRRI